MTPVEISAAPRQTGTSAARQTRREESVPCVLYGPNTEPVHFSVSELDLNPLIYTDEAHTVRVTVEGESYDCIIKAMQFDPITDRPRHVDFLRLVEGRPIKTTLPVRYTGTSKGQQAGGVPRQVLKKIQIQCLPEVIPAYLSVDVTDIGIGDTLHVSDVEKEGIEFLASGRQTLFTVVPPRGGLAAATEDEEGEESADAAEVPATEEA
jgi:large subunit ribosomal protein L25